MNPAHLSRSDLVRALLAPPAMAFVETPSAVGDGEHPYPVIAANDCTVEYKLGIARELLLRDLHDSMCTGPVLGNPESLRDWLRLYCAKLHHEVFLVLYLNAQLQLIEAVEMFRGTHTQTSVYPRELVRGAIERNAAAIVIAHNHPSGSTEPSSADEMLTRTLKTALGLVDVRVIDHFIVGGDSVLSFAQRGLM